MIKYPFVAVVGNLAATRALLLLAIEPGLRGVLIASPDGSDERALARAFGSLLQPASEDWPRHSAAPFSNSEADSGVIELPVNITEDRLLGALDLERTMVTGKRQTSTGLLAQAHGRVVYVNNINLLDSASAAHLAQALDSRTVCLEREGLTAIHDADFMLIGTFNSDEGEPCSLLRDRVGLIVDSQSESSLRDKAEIVERAFRFEGDASTFADDFALETAQLKSALEEARARLPRVRVSKEQLRQIAQIAMRLGVEGNRADVFAAKAARASAALAGRAAVAEDDLVVAIQLVLAPRATKLSSPREETSEQNESSHRDNSEETTPPETEDGSANSTRGPIADMIDEMIISAIDAPAPTDLIAFAQPSPRSSRYGKRFSASSSTRGRYVRSSMRRTREARVAIDATLRAAAPFQLARRARNELSKGQSLAGDAKIESRARRRSHLVKIEPGDLRFKEFKHRSGILFIFAVDASGSMALNRMAQAKGALARLLQQAYRHRDKVALISFRGERSDVLLAPTRSVEMAKRLVDALPASGGTPLSAGVAKAIELARLARLRGTSQAMLVLFTDGRANVGLGDGRANRTTLTIGEELTRLGAELGLEGIASVVVDTKSRFVSSGEAEALARTLGARYVYLPRSDAEAVYDAITSAAGRPA